LHIPSAARLGGREREPYRHKEREKTEHSALLSKLLSGSCFEQRPYNLTDGEEDTHHRCGDYRTMDVGRQSFNRMLYSHLRQVVRHCRLSSPT
jgi:hypothetical protein